MADYQLTYNGLTIGDGTSYDIAAISGLSQPGVRTADVALARRHGLHPGEDFLAGRTVTMTVEVDADDAADMSTKLAALHDAFTVGQPNEADLTLQIPGVCDGLEVTLGCRPRRVDVPVGVEYVWANLPVCTIQLFATDPLFYRSALGFFNVPVSQSGGLDAPIEAPLVFGGTTTGGLGIATNAGNFDGRLAYVLVGPCTNPRLQNVTTGQAHEFDIELTSGETLLVDTRDRSVLLGGTANRYEVLTANHEWWELAPGDNDLQYRVSAGGGAIIGSSYSAWTA